MLLVGENAEPESARQPRGALGRVRVRLEGEHLAYDYPDGAPRLLPAWFRFQFELGSARARYVVTPVGVGERVDE